jgi:DNA-binding MarR family transcriptional regulator
MNSFSPVSEPEVSEPLPINRTALSLGRLPELLGFHLRMAHIAVYRDFMESMAELDLTQKQSATIQLIAANAGVSQVDLANTLGTDRATMMAVVDRLEERGLITRRRSRADRRRQELLLTKEGQAILRRLRKIQDEHEKHFTSRFTKEELDALFDALDRIHGKL